MRGVFKKACPDAKVPGQGSEESAGYDMYACSKEKIVVNPGETVGFATGLAMAMPAGFGGFVFARSGLGIRHGIVPGNCVGVIDSDYRGEVVVGLHNHSDTPYEVSPGERIAQLVILALPKW